MSMEAAEMEHKACQQIADSGFLWDRVLSDEVTECILSRVPLSSLVRACAVNKHWKEIIQSPEFARLCNQVRPSNPWLFVYCTNFLLPGKNQAYAYDPDANTWYTVPSVSPPTHSRASMSGGIGGIMVATMSGLQSRLCYNHSLFIKKWKQTTEMSVSRDAPLVGFVEESASGGGGDVSQKLIAVGGVEMFEDDDLAVEIYDTSLKQWEVAKSMPVEFRGNSSRHWLSGAVWNRKLYILEIYSGSVSAFDLVTKTWTNVQILRPMTPSGVKYAYLVVCQGHLILAGVCHPPGSGQVSFKLWLVDDSVMQCKEVGVMPPEFFSLFAKGDGEKNVLGMKCVASGSLIFVYSVSPDAEYPMVVCDLNKGWNAWQRLPELPTHGSRFDTMVGFCSSVSLRVRVNSGNYLGETK
ncbi:hypothetical protein R1sor_009385 [Riccia sorocarpa]|uniref:F-box domain-containing protein n=1 Tax=Riccia sorocarpa TaxID=122646 RepID=A0ABD3HYB5_9MARC